MVRPAMPTQEVTELKEMIGQLHTEIRLMRQSLSSCQRRCLVDNPPGRWRYLGRALLAMIRF
jgi:hypothetical protein